MLGPIDRSEAGFPSAVEAALRRCYPFIDKLDTTSEYSFYNYGGEFANKRLLVIGGGPTTDAFDWDPANYDGIITCNHFFLHPRLNNLKVDLAAISPEVDVTRPEFIEYYRRYDTKFLINNHDVKDHVVDVLHNVDPSRLTIMENRFRVKIGQGPHLIILATFFNPLSIDFIGIDGYPPGTKIGDDACHTFEKGKRASGTRHSYQTYVDQFGQLWQYLSEVGKHITYRNLGYGHPYNVSSQFINVRVSNRER